MCEEVIKNKNTAPFSSVSGICIVSVLFGRGKPEVRGACNALSRVLKLVCGKNDLVMDNDILCVQKHDTEQVFEAFDRIHL